MTNDCIAGSDKGFGLLDGRGGIFRHRERFALIAINLLGVEDGGGARHEAGLGRGHASVGILVLELQLLVEDDKRALLAFADLASTVLPLAVSAPDAFGIAARFARNPEVEDVDTTIVRAGVDIDRTIEPFA